MTPGRMPSITAVSVVTVALAALLIDFSGIHLFADSDTFVPSFVAMQHWTPFYWGQDRYGMLVPLLAIPVEEPLLNFLLINGICIFLALLTPVLVGKWLAGDDGAVGGLAASALLVLALPDRLRAEWLSAQQPYGTSMALAALGMLLLDGKRVLAWVALVLACWVNVATPLWLFPVVLVEKRRAWRDWAVLLGAAALGALFMHLADFPTTMRTLNAPGEIPAAWLKLMERLLALPVAIVLGVPLALISAGLVMRVKVMRAVSGLLFAAVLGWLVMGSLRWVHANLYAPRYLIPSLVLVVTAGMIVGASLTHRHVRGLAPLVGAACVLLGAGPATLGLCSLKQVRDDLMLNGGVDARQLVELRCTHVLGEYWRIYPAAFLAEQLWFERGSPTRIYALGDRADQQRAQWMTVPGWRVGLVLGGKLTERVPNRLGLPPLFPTGEQGSTIMVLDRTER